MKDREIPLLGAALGDALGAGVEGGTALARAMSEDPEGIGRRFFPYSGFGFEEGELTDDTQMAWCAVAELRRGLPDLTMERGRREYLERVGAAYRAWYRSGPPDVGIATSAALRIDSVEGGWQSWGGGTSAGNGSLMRATAPFAAGYRGEALLLAAALDSSLTHPDPRCVAACVWYAATLEPAPEELSGAMRAGLRALERSDVAAWLDRAVFRDRWPEGASAVRQTVEGALSGVHVDCRRSPREEWPTGFVISSLGQAAWASLQAERADEALRLAVLHGGRDADTIGAIAGGLIGARFGRAALDHWDPALVKTLRLGHHWAGVDTRGAFLDLLEAGGGD